MTTIYKYITANKHVIHTFINPKRTFLVFVFYSLLYVVYVLYMLSPALHSDVPMSFFFFFYFSVHVPKHMDHT